MKRLTETTLFHCLRSGEVINLTEAQLKLCFDDFARSVIFISTETEGETPAYFTLHYTRMELDNLALDVKYPGAGEKYPDHILSI